MKQYYMVAAASKGYQPGLSALLNSFRQHHRGMGIKIVVCDYDLEPEFIQQYDGDDIEWVKVDSKFGNVWATKIERFRIASELDGVVGVFDSDMYVTAPMLNCWRIAEAGMIVGGSNGSNIGFGNNWNEQYKMDVPECFDYKTLTSVPTFMDIEKHGEVWRSLYEHKKTTNAGADFNLLNIFLMKLGKMDDIVAWPCETMTGVHHLQIKVDCGIINKAGKLLTKNGLELLCVHGRYWSGDWYSNLMKPMPKYCARLGIRSSRSRAYQEALKSRQLLKDEFEKYCDWPYDFTVKPATEANLQHEIDTYFTETESLEEENRKLSEMNLELTERVQKLVYGE